MTTYLEIHAIHSVPPSNMNRDDTGSPKSAVYGGVARARVSSQSWKRVIREDFNATLSPEDVGVRSRQLVTTIAQTIVADRPDLAERAQELAVDAMEAAGFKRPVPKTRGKAAEGVPETGYLVFLSRRQIEILASTAIEAADSDDPKTVFKEAKLKAAVDAKHSIDIALFGRMIADSTDLNVDAACQVAHALSVHEAVPEYDFFTAVDDQKSGNEEEEDSGAGMMGTVGYVSSTFYRYAVINMDQLAKNLDSPEAVAMATRAFLKSFINTVPSGKQNTFANGTRPSAVMVTVGSGQPTNLVGAFEEPVKSSTGFVKPAVNSLARHANEVFETWRRPHTVLISGLPSDLGALKDLGEVLSVEELTEMAVTSALEQE